MLTPADLKDGKVSVTKNVVYSDEKRIGQTPKSDAGFRSVPVPDAFFWNFKKFCVPSLKLNVIVNLPLKNELSND